VGCGPSGLGGGGGRRSAPGSDSLAPGAALSAVPVGTCTTAFSSFIFVAA
jgi:hypothetical protein